MRAQRSQVRHPGSLCGSRNPSASSKSSPVKNWLDASSQPTKPSSSLKFCFHRRNSSALLTLLHDDLVNIGPEQCVGLGHEILASKKPEPVCDDVEHRHCADALDARQAAQQRLVMQRAAERPAGPVLAARQGVKEFINRSARGERCRPNPPLSES